jgi:hypothetical protein
LPWERLLWSGRPWRPLLRARGVRYALTDFRLVRAARAGATEIALGDIAGIHLTRSRVDRLVGTSTIRVASRRRGAPALALTGVRRGPQLAALLDLLSGLPQTTLDKKAVDAALAWEPRTFSGGQIETVAALAVVAIAMVAIAVSMRGSGTMAAYAPDDPIRPNGQLRSRDEIARFMEADVMPWARAALGPIRGGADRVTCETCHGRNAEARHWQMPGVAALPRPGVKNEGWERYSGGMDAQMRNAIYGYAAESDKQHHAAYMREVIVPGMARLLHRPAYDFTRTYEYNRSRLAFGCYHCHRVK